MYITHSCVGIQYQVPLRRRLPQHERARAGRRNWSLEVAEFVDFVFGGLLVLATASLATSEFSQVVKSELLRMTFSITSIFVHI